MQNVCVCPKEGTRRTLETRFSLDDFKRRAKPSSESETASCSKRGLLIYRKRQIEARCRSDRPKRLEIRQLSSAYNICYYRACTLALLSRAFVANVKYIGNRALTRKHAKTASLLKCTEKEFFCRIMCIPYCIALGTRTL